MNRRDLLIGAGALGAAYAAYRFIDWPGQPVPAPKPRRPRPFRPWHESVDLPPVGEIEDAAPLVEMREQLAGADGKQSLWFGYIPEPRATAQFVQSLPAPHLTAAAPQLVRDAGDGEPVLLYRYLLKAFREVMGRPWAPYRQGIGDCVSMGWANAVDIASAIDFVRGDSGDWLPAATEAIYGGSRVEARGRSTGGWSDGSYGAAAAKWVKDWGVLWRQEYERFDLTEYDPQRAKQWGNYGNGGQGDNGWADTIARDHPVQDVALVRSFKEAAAAIENGYPVPVCSGAGFQHQRDRQGFARRQGSWAHCMNLIAVRYDRPGLLCQNSWGPTWITGPKWPADQPDGSFWVDADVVDRMLSGGDSFSVATVKGFPRRKLRHDEGWLGWKRMHFGGVAV